MPLASPVPTFVLPGSDGERYADGLEVARDDGLVLKLDAVIKSLEGAADPVLLNEPRTALETGDDRRP